MNDPLNIVPMGKELIDHAMDRAFDKVEGLLTQYRWRVVLIERGVEITADRRTVDGLKVETKEGV